MYVLAVIRERRMLLRRKGKKKTFGERLGNLVGNENPWESQGTSWALKITKSNKLSINFKMAKVQRHKGTAKAWSLQWEGEILLLSWEKITKTF